MARYEFDMIVTNVIDNDNILNDKISIGDELTLEIEMPYRPPSNYMRTYSTPIPFEMRAYNARIQFNYNAQHVRNWGMSWDVQPKQNHGDSCTTGLNMDVTNSFQSLITDPTACPYFAIEWKRTLTRDDPDCFIPDTLNMLQWTQGTILFSDLFDRSTKLYKVYATFGQGRLTELTGGAMNITAFHDLNGNCRREAGEPGIDNVSFTVGSQPFVLKTESNGELFIQSPLSKGYLTILPQDDWELNCTGDQITYDLIALGPNPTVEIPLHEKPPVVDRPKLPAAPLSIGATALRPGETADYIIFLNNQDENTQDGTLRFEFDERLRYVSSKPAPSEVNLPLLVWDVNQIEPEERRRFIVRFKVPNDPALQGENFCSATKFDYDGQRQFYLDSYCQVVAGDYDPVRLQRIKQDKTQENETVDAQVEAEFIIQIHNDDSRTARNVHVTIPATTDFDLNRLFVGAASHEYATSKSEDGDIIISFHNIMLAPDGADVNTEAFVRFGVTQDDVAFDDEFVREQIDVRFDYIEDVDAALSAAQTFAGPPQFGESEAVVSDVAADLTLGEVRVFPNPTSDVVTIALNSAEWTRKTTISLTNLVGQTVLTRTMLNNNYSLDVRTLPAGSYYLTLQRGTATAVHHLKIMRQTH